MKKTFLAIVLLLSFFSLQAMDRRLTFDGGLVTGFPFYGDTDIKDGKEKMMEKGGRVIIGSTADINFAVMDSLTLFAGADFLADLASCKTDYYDQLDYAFFGGLKIYPGFGGLNLSLAYALGNRSDFTRLEDEKTDSSTAWGNGMRFSVEYNFSHTNFYYLYPSIGLYWRWIPRGDFKTDHILAAYILLNF